MHYETTPSDDSQPLGIPAARTHPGLQTDAYKEIINKIAWAIGSSYRVPYRNARTGARYVAIGLARDLVGDHGYPRHLEKT